MADDFDWSDENVARLRALWTGTSLSTAEIGRRLGCSKNATVGKAHRLGLPARPSPIKRDGGPRKPAPLTRTVRRKALSLPVLTSVQAEPVDRFEGRVRHEAQMARKSLAPLLLKVEEPAPVFKPRKATACCWPTGEGKAIRFVCEAAAVVGKPYCPEHHARAFTPLTRENADLASWLPNRQGVVGGAGVGFV